MSKLRDLIDAEEEKILTEAYRRYSEELVGECSNCRSAIRRDEWAVLFRYDKNPFRCFSCGVLVARR